MSKTFKGRVVLSGNVSGKATVSRQAFNTSGSYFENMFAGRTDAAPCTDAANKELYGKDLSGAILCIPTTKPSHTPSTLETTHHTTHITRP
jgi:predicted aconitase with swiveling domain